MANNGLPTVEFRGCDHLVIAEVTADDVNNAYTTGAVQVLAPVAEIAKTVENSSETHYYDNVGMIIIRSEGSDEVTLTVPALPLSTLALVTGKQIDTATGAFIDGETVERYFAIGYRLRLTDGTYRYVWRLKGTFNFPDETSATENDGTDTNNQELVFTGVKAITEFTNGGRAKAVVVDERDGLCDCSSFFDTVQTPDTLGSLSVVTDLAVLPTSVSVALGATTTITATKTPSTAAAPVVWSCTPPGIATIDQSGVVTPVATGTAIVTASCGSKTATCVVTVTQS